MLMIVHSALVIGNASYQGAKLGTPIQDADDIAHTFMWYTLDVAKWLKSNTKMDIDDAEIGVLNVIHHLNIVWAQAKADPLPGIEKLAQCIAA